MALLQGGGEGGREGQAREERGLEGVVGVGLAAGNGASRQIVVFEANHDLREVVGEIVAKTDPAWVEAAD